MIWYDPNLSGAFLSVGLGNYPLEKYKSPSGSWSGALHGSAECPCHEATHPYNITSPDGGGFRKKYFVFILCEERSIQTANGFLAKYRSRHLWGV